MATMNIFSRLYLSGNGTHKQMYTVQKEIVLKSASVKQVTFVIHTAVNMHHHHVHTR